MMMMIKKKMNFEIEIKKILKLKRNYKIYNFEVEKSLKLRKNYKKYNFNENEMNKNKFYNFFEKKNGRKIIKLRKIRKNCDDKRKLKIILEKKIKKLKKYFEIRKRKLLKN